MADLEDLGDNIQNFREETENLIGAVTSLGEKIREAIKDAIDNTNGLDNAAKRTAKTYERDIYNATRRVVGSLDDQFSIQEKINKGALTQTDIQKRKDKLARNEAVIQSRINLLVSEGIIEQGEVTAELQKQIEIERKLIDQIEIEIDRRKKVQGIIGSSAKGLDGLLRKAGQKDLADKLNIPGAIEAATTFDKTTGKAAFNAGEAFKNVGKNLVGAFSKADIATAILLKVGKTLKSIDKEVVNLQRGFAVTKGEALDINQELARTATTAFTLGVNLETVTKATGDLNAALGGTANLFNADIRNGVAFAEDRLKLSAEAATNLGIAAVNAGVEFDSILQSNEAAFKQIQANTGVALNFTQTIEAANKISGALRLNLEATPGGLVAATAAAKSLGLELENIKGIQSAILDFESSIAAELEAEVLTGRELNLERARLAALNNDIVTLTEEIASQFGSIEEFQSLNYIQQEAFAKSVGMSSDALADVLRKQTAINNTMESGVKTQGESLTQNASALSAQEALAKSMQSLNTVLKTSLAVLLGLAGAAAVLLAVPTAGASLVALGAIGGIAAGAGIQAVMDGTAPSDKGPFTITDAYGATAVTAKGDNVVVSPNVSQGDNEQKRTNILLERLLAKDTNISMDGRKLNDSMSTSAVSYEIGI